MFYRARSGTSGASSSWTRQRRNHWLSAGLLALLSFLGSFATAAQEWLIPHPSPIIIAIPPAILTVYSVSGKAAAPPSSSPRKKTSSTWDRWSIAWLRSTQLGYNCFSTHPRKLSAPYSLPWRTAVVTG